MHQFLLRVVVAVSLAGSTANAPAHAAFLTGNELFEKCLQQAPNYLEMGTCLGFVGGTADAMAAAQISGGTAMGLRACLPPGVTAWQARDVVMRFLTYHPEVRHHAAAPLVARALAAAFPCPTRY
jgi:hypothetical protein